MYGGFFSNCGKLCRQHEIGTSVETEIHGKRELRLLSLGETYVMNCPKLLIRFLPIPGVDWSGVVKINCQETDLAAELHYGGNFLLGRNRRSVKGRIFQSSSSTVLYEIDGRWDRYIYEVLCPHFYAHPLNSVLPVFLMNV